MESEFFSGGSSSGDLGSNQLIKYIAIGLVAAAIAYAVYYFSSGRRPTQNIRTTSTLEEEEEVQTLHPDPLPPLKSPSTT